MGQQTSASALFQFIREEACDPSKWCIWKQWKSLSIKSYKSGSQGLLWKAVMHLNPQAFLAVARGTDSEDSYKNLVI